MLSLFAKNPVQNRIVLYVLGIFLTIIILWGVFHMKILTDMTVRIMDKEVAVPVRQTLSQGKTIQGNIETSAKEENGVASLTGEETRVRLENLMAEEGDTASLTEEDVRAKLEMVPSPEYAEEHDADHTHQPDVK